MAVLRPLLESLFEDGGKEVMHAFCSAQTDGTPEILGPLVDPARQEFIRTVWSIGFSRRPEDDGEIGKRRKKVKELVEGRKKWIEDHEKKERAKAKL
jgi:hypothetical protein